MLSTASLVALLALLVSFTALNLFSLDYHPGDMNLTQTAGVVLPLALIGGLLVAVASMYHQLRRGAVAAAGAGMDAVAAVCVAVGVLEFFTFVCKPAGEGGDDGARARELATAAAHLLPAAATATFFLGVTLLLFRVRGGAGGGAGEGRVQILVKITLGATAVLVGLMALALALTI